MLLYAATRSVIVNGHDARYERFASTAPDGRRHASRGNTEFGLREPAAKNFVLSARRAPHECALLEAFAC